MHNHVDSHSDIGGKSNILCWRIDKRCQMGTRFIYNAVIFRSMSRRIAFNILQYFQHLLVHGPGLRAKRASIEINFIWRNHVLLANRLPVGFFLY